MMKNKLIVLAILGGFFPAYLFSAGISAQNITATKPNVILILGDDIGAECLGSYGSTMYTSPRIDKMASEGAVFQNAFAAANCTPSRVMLMSGMYANRTGFRSLLGMSGTARLPVELKTIGTYFKEAGYRTAIAGKWQLGNFEVYPNQMAECGFDEYCMWTSVYKGESTSRYYSPNICENGKFIQGSNSDFGPDLYSRFLLKFIEQNKDRPFFVYYPMALVHSPFLAPPKSPGLPAQSKLATSAGGKTSEFAKMITYHDNIVGQFLDKLKELGLDKNTLVIYTGDNGTHAAIKSRLYETVINGGKGSMTEAGTRVPFICWWPGKVSPGNRDQFISLVDIVPTLGKIAGFKPGPDVDGMDLSHNFWGETGVDREHVFLAWKSYYYLRGKNLRLNLDAKGGVTLFDIPVNKVESRYSEKLVKGPEFREESTRMLQIIKRYTSIEQIQFREPDVSGVPADVLKLYQGKPLDE